MSKPILSPSRLNMLCRCPVQYDFVYNQKIKIPPGIALPRGGGVHSAAEADMRHKLKARVDLPRKDVVDIGVAAFDERVKEEGVLLTEEEESIGKDNVIGATRDAVARLSGLWIDNVAPKVQPAMVEESIVIPVPESSHDLGGRIDVLDEHHVLLDWKTRNTKKPEGFYDGDVQLTVYALSVLAKTGKLPSGIGVYELVDTMIPKAHQHTTTRAKGDFKALIARFDRAVKSIESGVFMPAMPGSWWCSSKWCGFYRTGRCPFVKSYGSSVAR